MDAAIKSTALQSDLAGNRATGGDATGDVISAFENVIGSEMPVAINLMGTQERVLWSMGMERPEELEALGERLALPLVAVGDVRMHEPSRAPLAASCRMQSGIAPWPGTTTRSAARIAAGSAVTRTSSRGATCSSALATERRLPIP